MATRPPEITALTWPRWARYAVWTAAFVLPWLVLAVVVFVLL